MYVGYGLGGVTMYKVPTWEPVAHLNGIESAFGLCVDSSQNVYAADAAGGQLVEFKHGSSKPLRTLGDATGSAYGCAINPTNGDVAVANYTLVSEPCGDIVIFHHGSGSPKTYTTASLCEDYQPAYDASGDLFVDGHKSSGIFGMAELASGQKNFVDVTFGKIMVTTGSIPISPGGLHWDGQYLDVGDSFPTRPFIFRMSISDSEATLHQRVVLRDIGGTSDFCLPKYGTGTKNPYPRHVISTGSPQSGGGLIAQYDFPVARKPQRSLGDQVFPDAVVVSLPVK